MVRPSRPVPTMILAAPGFELMGSILSEAGVLRTFAALLEEAPFAAAPWAVPELLDFPALQMKSVARRPRRWPAEWRRPRLPAGLKAKLKRTTRQPRSWLASGRA